MKTNPGVFLPLKESPLVKYELDEANIAYRLEALQRQYDLLRRSFVEQRHCLCGHTLGRHDEYDPEQIEFYPEGLTLGSGAFISSVTLAREDIIFGYGPCTKCSCVHSHSDNVMIKKGRDGNQVG